MKDACIRACSQRSQPFADLGLPNSEQELFKAKLTLQIYKLIKERELTQSKAAELLGTTQAQVSALMRCRPVSVSVGRLMEFLTVLGQDVEVTVKSCRDPLLKAQAKQSVAPRKNRLPNKP